VLIDASTSDTGSSNAVVGIFGNYTFTPSTASAVEVGNRFVINNNPSTNANTSVGQIIRTIDNTALANTVRGIEVVSNAGSNTAGVNTGIRTTGATFGLQSFTSGAGGGVSIPAAIYAENTGVTTGEILRLYTGSMTSAPNIAQFYQELSGFSGNGLYMALGQNGGSFTGNFLKLDNGSLTKFLINNNGEVAVGTTTPSAKLYVEGTYGSSTTLFAVASSTSSTGATSSLFTVFSDGKVGIGTSTPGQILTVQGTIRQTNCTTAGGLDANASGDIICTPSSERFKNTIATLTEGDGIAVVNALRPVSFKFNEDMNMGSSTYLGFIAEEANTVDSRLVRFDGTGAIQGFQYENFTAILAKAIQQQQAILSGATTSLALATSSIATLQSNLASATSTLTTTTATLATFSSIFDIANATTSIASLTVGSTGNIGLGTSTPTEKLSVVGNVMVGSSTATTFFVNAQTGFVGIGNNRLSPLYDETLRVGGSIVATSFDTDGAADVAETFPAAEAVDAGTVVAFATSTQEWSPSRTSTSTYQMSKIEKAKDPYTAIGIISTAPGIRLGGRIENGVPVAFTGRVPVKVTTENGEIKRGDYITVSTSTPGFAMKLTGEGRALGVAVSDDTGSGYVLVLLQIGNHKLDLTGKSASTTAMLTTGNVDLNANGVAIYNIKSLASANGSWSIDEEGRVVSKELKTEQLCVGDVCVNRDQFLQMVQTAGASTSTPTVSSGSNNIIETNATTTLNSNATSTTPQETASTTTETGITPETASSTPTVTDITTPIADTVAPVLTLNGSSEVTLNIGDVYNEEGATATDGVDGDVVVVVSGSVETSIAGVYTVTYTATDLAGNYATVSRTITVLEVN
jgi:hypothetical protein